MEREKPLKQLIEERLKKLEKLKNLGIEPFGYKFERTHKIQAIGEKYGRIKPGKKLENIKVKIAGRIKAKRIHGKASFADLEDEDGRIQLFFSFESLGDKKYSIFKDLIDAGDIIGVEGFIFKTQKGELSVWVKDFTLLSKSLRPLPKEWFGLKDVKVRYTQRYLDMIMNKDVRKRFIVISNIMNVMREFLVSKGFVEVDTPALQTVYGGAFAKPFETYHNYLKEKMYLRIAPELHLKRLLVGGLEKVFEFAKCFRNESVDASHNPEFLQLEIYQAYANYEDTMKLVEDLIYFVGKKMGKTELEYQGNKIKLKPPWKRIPMFKAIEKYGRIDVLSLSYEELKEIAKENGIEKIRRGEIIEALFEKFAQPKLIQPTFITLFPADIAPLAKKAKDARFAERYEGYIVGIEICNGYTELNNPIEQFKRFEEEEELRKKFKDLEFMPMDRDFIRALEYGMPPASGIGIGIARIASIFTNTTSIKEVIAFPTVSGKEKIEVIPDIIPEARKFG